MGRDDYRNEDDRTRRRRERGEDYRDYYPPRKPRSGVVGALAVLNFVVGPLVIMFGVCAGLMSGVLPETLQFLLGVPGGLGDSAMAIIIPLVAIFLWGAAAIVTAIGLLYRGGWARILALLNGGCAFPVGLLYFTLAMLFMVGTTTEDRAYHVIMSLAKTVFFLGYGIWTYIVLLNPKRTEEFR
jgi:hypothetical protein